MVVQQIGQQKTKMAEIRDLDKATTEIIEVPRSLSFSLDKSDEKTNIKRMERVQLRHSHINMAKTKPRSPSSIIVPCLNQEHTIVLEMLSADAVALNAAEEDNYKDWVDVEVGVAEINKAADGAQASVVEDSDGKITINLNVFAMQVSKSSQNGNYLKKSNSIDFPSWP